MRLLAATIFAVTQLLACRPARADDKKYWEELKYEMFEDFDKRDFKKFESAARKFLERSKSEPHLNTPLHDATYLRNTSAAEFLISIGFDVNHRGVGLTPLMNAARIGDVKMVSLLLDNGAKTEIRSKECIDPYFECYDVVFSGGWTAFMFSRAEYRRPGDGTLEVEALLLKRGANPLAGLAEGHYDFTLAKISNNPHGWKSTDAKKFSVRFSKDGNVQVYCPGEGHLRVVPGTFSFSKSSLTIHFKVLSNEMKKCGLQESIIWRGGILGQTMFINDDIGSGAGNAVRYMCFFDQEC